MTNSWGKFYRTESIRVFLFAIFLALNLAQFAKSDNYIIVYKDHARKNNMLKSRPAFTVRRNFHIIPAISARLDPNQLKQLRVHPDIAYIEPDYKVFAVGAADINDINTVQPPANLADTSAQTIPYGVSLVNAPQVWPRTKGAGARVAVLDTGIAMYHPDRGNVVLTTSFATDSSNNLLSVEDFDGHGTHTSGTVAAADNNIGVVGVAPQIQLLIAKVMDNSGNGETSWIIAGIEWAVDNGAKVISMSLGEYDYSSSLDSACSNALAAGVVLVAAAGNDGSSSPLYPAAYSSVISVAAVDSSKNRASFSNYGSTIDLSAPGVSVYSTVPVSVDTSATAEADWQSVAHQANLLLGTAPGSVSGTICNCGLGTGTDEGNSCPNSVAGNIAHIRRGTITFQQKVAYAQSKGAIGVIISNYQSGNFNGTINDGTPCVVVSISQSDGDNLQSLYNVTGTVSVSGTLYTYYSGTSMATPHVAGVAGLLFAANPNLSAQEVTNILFDTAQDLGTAGRDDYYGYGLVDAYAALQMGRMTSLADFTIFWLQTCSSSDWCSGYDYNHTGSVNFIDFSTFANNW